MTAIRNPPGVELPLTARSVIASLLLGMHPPRMRGLQLVRWCALFGVAEGTARVALHRMAARGELVASDGSYELAGALAARQRAQDWSLDPEPLDWSGEWRLGVVERGSRAATRRQHLRDAMRRLRFAELREGVWLRPDNLPASAATPGARAIADEQARWFNARPDGDGAELVALFAPDAWASEARVLCTRLEHTADALAREPEGAIADAFVLGAATLQHVRADPLLPAELLATPWPGRALRDVYHAYQDAFATAVADWFAR